MFRTPRTPGAINCSHGHVGLRAAQAQPLHHLAKRHKGLPQKQVSCQTYTADRHSAESSTSSEEDDWLVSEDEDEDFEETGTTWTNPNSLQTISSEFEASEEEIKKNAESRACAVAMARIAWDTKGEDISVLHVAPLVYWCSYMVLVTIKSRPQMQAIVGKIEQQAEQQWGRNVNELASGMRGSDWEAIDLMDVVVHVFTAEQREKYQLDAYYEMAEEVELPFLEEEASGLQWTTKRA